MLYCLMLTSRLRVVLFVLGPFVVFPKFYDTLASGASNSTDLSNIYE